MPTTVVTRDISPGEKKPRNGGRAPGEVPYPVKLAPAQLVFDNWNTIFLKALFRGMSARQAETPPSNVLDLGCGTGLWILEAAKQWPECNFTGMDCHKIQPDLQLYASQPGMGPNISERIRWVSGNILDPLPFKRNCFDFVRVCCVGLGIPEDETQFFLQEISRVLIPGGIVELIEEDAIFPCGTQQEWKEPADAPPAVLPQSRSTDTILEESPKASRTSKLAKSSSTRLVASLFPTDSVSSQGSGDDPFETAPEPTRIDYLEVLDPKNHSKLKAAWDSLLQKRFLPRGLLSVLQFYFTAEFDELHSFPTLQIPLPPNTRLYEAEPPKEHDKRTPTLATYDNLALGSLAAPSDMLPDPVLEAYHGSPNVNVAGSVVCSTWAAMHLGRMVSLVQGCQDAIWEEYKTLEVPSQTHHAESDLKDEFQAAWLNWECDMKDRMRMRKNMFDSVSWTPGGADEAPECKAWRERAGFLEADEEDPTVDHKVCRALRAFVGRKPFNRDQ